MMVDSDLALIAADRQLAHAALHGLLVIDGPQTLDAGQSGSPDFWPHGQVPLVEDELERLDVPDGDDGF